jgi:hypothetical protein
MTQHKQTADADAFAKSLANGKTAFVWADTHARLGDYEYALKWLDVGMRLADNPPSRFSSKRRQWARALSTQRQQA